MNIWKDAKRYSVLKSDRRRYFNYEISNRNPFLKFVNSSVMVTNIRALHIIINRHNCISMIAVYVMIGSMFDNQQLLKIKSGNKN